MDESASETHSTDPSSRFQFRCATCHALLSNPLLALAVSLLEAEDGKPRIGPGYFAIEDGDMYTGTQGEFAINLTDAVGTRKHHDPSKLGGCCGPSGTGGLNLLCENGHEVGTLRADCWIPHAVTFEPTAVTLEAA